MIKYRDLLLKNDFYMTMLGNSLIWPGVNKELALENGMGYFRISESIPDELVLETEGECPTLIPKSCRTPIHKIAKNMRITGLYTTDNGKLTIKKFSNIFEREDDYTPTSSTKRQRIEDNNINNTINKYSVFEEKNQTVYNPFLDHGSLNVNEFQFNPQYHTPRFPVMDNDLPSYISDIQVNNNEMNCPDDYLEMSNHMTVQKDSSIPKFGNMFYSNELINSTGLMNNEQNQPFDLRSNNEIQMNNNNQQNVLRITNKSSVEEVQYWFFNYSDGKFNELREYFKEDGFTVLSLTLEQIKEELALHSISSMKATSLYNYIHL